ncbi:MAG: winged helix DNA-binding protein [Spirochaetales bacterium]|nr:winged helix DNA-binding protein [Spirochaetales bacterium]
MDKAEMAPIVIGKLMNIGGMLQKRANLMLAPFQLNQQQYSILFSIYQEDRVQQKNVINKLMLEKAHVSKVVKKLHSMDLIDIELSEQDKRSSWLMITDKGKKLVHKVRGVSADWNKQWTGELDMNQMNQLLESLTMIQNVFKEKALH